MTNARKIDLMKWMAMPDPAALLEQYAQDGTLAEELPEVAALAGIEQSAQWHPEIDTLVHTRMTLEVASKLSTDPRVRYAALVHDLGKALTPKHELPAHHSHEERGVALTKALAQRFDLPEEWEWLGAVTSQYHLHSHKAFDLKASTVVDMVRNGGFLDRDPALFDIFVMACEADKRGRLGLMDTEYPQGAYLREAFHAIRDVVVVREIDLHASRVSSVKQLLRKHKEKRAEAAAHVA